MRTFLTAIGASAAVATVALAAAGTASAAATTLPGDGTFLVGVDIEPGLYVTNGPSGDIMGCWAERLSGLSGEYDDTIDSTYEHGRVVVDIAPTDVAFRTSDCQTWTRIGDSAVADPAPQSAPVPAPAPAAAPDLTLPLVGSAAVGSAVVGSVVLPGVIGLLATGS